MSRLLVVDDDSGNRRILGSRLAEHGHEVVAGENGALGLALARETRFDLVLVSTELKAGVDGFEVCRRVRALPESARPAIVLFCEQSPVPEVLERGYQAGCDAFVTRPDLPALEPILGNLLRQRSRLTEIDALCGGRFEFNGETHVLPEPLAWLHNPSTDIEWHILLHKFYYAVGLGRAYLASGEDRYAQR